MTVSELDEVVRWLQILKCWQRGFRNGKLRSSLVLQLISFLWFQYFKKWSRT